MNILFFTEISPFPINGGERIRSYGLLKALSMLNHKVLAIIQNQDQVSLKDYEIDNVEFVEFSEPKIKKLDRITGYYLFKKNKEVVSILKKNSLLRKTDLILLDFNLAGRYISSLKKFNIPIIIGTHNAESNLIWQKPSRNIFNFIRKVQHYSLMKIHEYLYYTKSDRLIVVSDEDLEFYTKFISKSKIHMIPNFLDESRYKYDGENEDYFVMTANFGAYMNYEGLKWLISKVWDLEVDANNKLILAGKQSIEALEEIRKIKKFKNIEAIGKVDDMTPIISKAKAVLIPLQQGSGSRLKCLEAMALKTSIIATSKGVEGIKSKNFIIANNSQEFKRKIQSFKRNEQLEVNLYKDFMKNYSLNANIIRVKEMIDSLNKS